MMVNDGDMFAVGDVDSRLPWADITDSDFEAAANSCEIRVTLRNRKEHALIRCALAFDKRSQGNRGRCLIRDFDRWGLRKGDRLEPSATVRDIGAGFDALAVGPFPFEIIMWRRSKETFLRHRCPVFAALSVNVLMVDVLHALLYGPGTSFCKAACWTLMIHDAWQIGGGIATSTTDVMDQLSVNRLWQELQRWYKTLPKEWDVCELEDMSMGFFGSRNHQDFRAKAMETRWLIPFCVHLVERYASCLPGALADSLKLAGHSLENLIRMMATSPDVPDGGTCQVGIFYNQRSRDRRTVNRVLPKPN